MKRGLGRIGAVVLTFALFCTWGCAAPGGAGKSPRLQAEFQDGESTNAPAVPGQTGRKVNITDVQVHDGAEETVIRITGNMPFMTYNLERLGEDRFVLDLDEVPGRAGLPSLPVGSSRVELSYGENVQKGGIQVVGNLRQPMGGHLLTNLDNSLILTLTFPGSSTPEPKARLRMDVPADHRVERASARRFEERNEPIPHLRLQCPLPLLLMRMGKQSQWRRRIGPR